jgi:predicted metal-dependent HD superfamily phosphohydrolase
MLRDIFNELCGRHSPDTPLIATLWKEIETHYAKKGRYYHNITHLENLYKELLPYLDIFRDRDMVLFSLFYHDIIHKATKSDNEEKSALVAEKRLSSLGVQQERIKTCVDHILATKGHTLVPNDDTNLFTDADLSILGQPANVYDKYTLDVRAEYKIYPDLLYRPGRKKVLQHFLQMERIFKTQQFYDKYEAAARMNLERELKTL